MYAIGSVLLGDLGSPTFQKRDETSEVGQNDVGPLEAGSGFCFRSCRDTCKNQHGQASEGPGGSDIGVQAIPYANNVSRTNTPGVSHEFQPCRLRLAND